jgi:hypothetical protein
MQSTEVSSSSYYINNRQLELELELELRGFKFGRSSFKFVRLHPAPSLRGDCTAPCATFPWCRISLFKVATAHAGSPSN